MTARPEFAILAPVPLEHLESGKLVAEQQGFVALGTRKWELLRRIDELRDGQRVPVLIYPSHEDVPAKDSFVVTWFGWYVGSEETRTGGHSAGMRHRPATTAGYPDDNCGYWAAFWHVEGLQELPKAKQLEIGKIGTVKGGWRKDAPPRGPELVALPDILSTEA